MTVSNWITAQVISLWWYNLQYCVHCLPCRPNRPLPKPVYEYEYIDSGTGDVALPNMTKNPSYMTANEVVSTRFASASEEDQKVDHTYEVLHFEANEEEGEDPIHGSQGNAVDGDQEATAGDVWEVE